MKPPVQLLTLLAALASMFATSTLIAGWTRTNGPYGGEISCTATDPSGTVLFAGTGVGLYRSTDSGVHWNSVGTETFTDDPWIEALAVSDSLVVAGTSRGGVYLSSDRGTTWRNAGTPYSQTFTTSVAISGSDLYAGNPFGVFRTSDMGKTWTQTYSGQIAGLFVDGTRLFSVSSQVTSGVVQVSTDRGDSWSGSFSWVPVQTLGRAGSSVVAGTQGFGIYRSTDHGATWSMVAPPESYYTITAFTQTSEAAYAGVAGAPRVYRSTDGGLHWSKYDSVNSVPSISCLAAIGSRIFAGTDRGLYASTDAGANWFHSDDGMQPAIINAFAVSGRNVLAGTWGVFLSTDAGLTWKAFERGMTDGYVSALAIRDTLFYAAASNGVFRSSLNAPQWTSCNTGPEGSMYPQAVCTLGSEVFVGGPPGGVYRSTDGGITWAREMSGVTDGYIDCLLADGTKLWAGTPSGVFASIDSGATWTPDGNAWGSAYALALAATESRIYAGTPWGLFWSNKDVVTWNPVDSPFGAIAVTALGVTAEQLFAATTGGFYASTGVATHWIASNDGLSSVWGNGLPEILTLAVTDSSVIISVNGDIGGGVFLQPRSQIVTAIGGTQAPAPTAFQLAQNFPNPFNPATTIAYDVPRQAFVNLTVYDMLGRAVAILVNEMRQPGHYEVRFDAGRLASGMYLYRLQANDYVATKRALVVK